MKTLSQLLPRKLILQSLVIQFLIGLPLFSFFILLMLGIYPEPGPTGEPLSFWQRITILHMWLALFSAAAFFSCMGSLVSYLSRGGDLSEQFSNESFVLSIHILGSIFGILLLLLFVGGFIAGNLFPDFKDVGFFRIFHAFYSITGWAKLFVWTFIAGFSERLVPGLLTNFTKKISETSED